MVGSISGFFHYREIVEKLRSGIAVEPEYFNEASVLFSNIWGFNDFVNGVLPQKVLSFLHQVYSVFDRSIQNLSVYKLETIGSSYLVRNWVQ